MGGHEWVLNVGEFNQFQSNKKQETKNKEGVKEQQFPGTKNRIPSSQQNFVICKTASTLPGRGGIFLRNTGMVQKFLLSLKDFRQKIKKHI